MIESRWWKPGVHSKREHAMTSNMRLNTQLSFNTTRLECDLPNGKKSYGTGFLFAFRDAPSGLQSNFLFTNSHVVEGVSSVTAFFTKSTPDGDPLFWDYFRLVLPGGEVGWTHHPDPNVDLCGFNLSASIEHGPLIEKRFFVKTFDEALLLQPGELDSVEPGRDIMMIGYPCGLWDEKHNMPIFRRGITATHVDLDYNGQKEFMIDAACYPGSSGSPVILYEPGNRVGAGLKGGASVVKLLGILRAIPQQTVEGKFETVPVPTQLMPVAKWAIPTNLGYVIRAERIRDFRPPSP